MTHEFFARPALEVAPSLLGARLTVTGDDGAVTIRITEVEAYHGVGVPGVYDAGSHSRDRRTDRNASMFGPPGHAYVYFTYGMHFALNLVCSPEGVASGVLLRAGEIVEGTGIAERRRIARRPKNALPIESLPSRQLARGPGNVAAALGITRPTHDGLDLFAAPFNFEAAQNLNQQSLDKLSLDKLGPDTPNLKTSIASGPRVGVSGEAGGAGFPWRFWLTDDPTVSSYRPGKNVPR